MPRRREHVDRAARRQPVLELITVRDGRVARGEVFISGTAALLAHLPTSRPATEAHRAAGRRFTAAGVGSFLRGHGDSEGVGCLHGVPVSSFL